MEITSNQCDITNAGPAADTVARVTAAGLPPVEITQFRGDHHFLSNFYKSPIQRDGFTYPTIEHAFQAAKCLDKAGKLSILGNKNPVMAKRLGRRVKLRPDWERVKRDVMHELLLLKFEPGGKFCDQLLATGDAHLIEGNKWHDNEWGSCMCEKHRHSRGANHLGKILMRVRDDLRSKKDGDASQITITKATTV